jgi:NAD(P)-dependent dehydrogenase (short-subunit alcohol dehydrogenase family)
MSTAITASRIRYEPQLLDQTVVVIGGSAGIGLETARRATAEGAKLILTGRNPEPLQRRERGRCAEHYGLRRHRSCAARAVFPRLADLSRSHHGDRWPALLRPPREKWNAGDLSPFHGWNKQAGVEVSSVQRKG